MKPWTTWFVHLGLAGTFVVVAGCAGADVPDEGPDGQATSATPPDKVGPASRSTAAQSATPGSTERKNGKSSEDRADPDHERYLRAAQANQAQARLLGKKLEEPIPMPFEEETPLEDVLKYVRTATTTATYQGIPIYVDPIGLAEADKSMSSTVRGLDQEGVPLKDTLKQLLRQLGLTFQIDEMVLVITKNEPEKRPQSSEPVWPSDGPTRAILAELEQVVMMPFSDFTPLDEVLSHIRAKTKSSKLPDGIPIEIDSQVLAGDAQARTGTVRLELLGEIPLRLSLGYVLGQRGLSYIVSIGKIRIVPD